MKLKKQQQSDSDRQTILHPGIEPVGFMGTHIHPTVLDLSQKRSW